MSSDAYLAVISYVVEGRLGENAGELEQVNVRVDFSLAHQPLRSSPSQTGTLDCVTRSKLLSVLL